MFSFARTVIDLIQSATGLKVKPSTLNGDIMEDQKDADSSIKQRKGEHCVFP